MADAPRGEEVEGALERVRRRLYATQETVSNAAETPRHREDSTGWKPDSPRPGLSASAWFFIIAVGFFLVAASAAILIVMFGARSVGNERMSVAFMGPVSVEGGEEFAFILEIANENPVEAFDVALTIDFPEEAFDPLAQAPRNHYQAQLQSLAPGASILHSVPLALFGSEGQKVSIPVTLEYRTQNSSAVFVKEEVRDMVIATAPLSLRIDAPEDVPSGQEITITARVRSNLEEALPQVAIKAELPFGFTRTASEPAPIGANVFPIGDLSPGEEKEISITGMLTGEDGDERVFRFSGGALDAGGTGLRAPALTLAARGVVISRSFIAADLLLNQTRDDLVVAPGETVSGIISWVNTLSALVDDARIDIVFSGDALDLDSIAVANGFYRSGERTLVFDKSTEPELRSLSPAETGAGAFTVLVKDAEALAPIHPPSATLTVSVAGRRTGEGGRQERVLGTVSRTIRVATDLSLEANLVHTIGPFENSGPIPPVANEETTYTALLRVRNTLNTAGNARVTAILPPYVRYTGFSEPSGITYDENSRTVTWDLGEVAPQVLREGAFQIAVTPSTAQRAEAPVLVEAIELRGFDRFAQTEVGQSVDPLTTETRADPGFQTGDERVK